MAYRTTIALGALMVAMTGAAAAQQRSTPQVRNYVAPGILESTVKLGCIELKAASPRYNPVDLFQSARACMAADRYDDAVALYTLPLAFGRFDTHRVADQTAHQAVGVARMEIFGDVSQDVVAKFGDHVRTFTAEGPQHSSLCTEITRIGPPSYFPRYMIQHGMGAFVGHAGNGLVADFDAASAWRDVLSTYLKCPAS